MPCAEKFLSTLTGENREAVVEAIKPQLIVLKKSNYGKQIAAIEKLIYTAPSSQRASYTSKSTYAHSKSTVCPMDIVDTTPMLTHGQNSPQSSSLPSTRGSTAGDAPNLNLTAEKSFAPEGEVLVHGA